MIDLSTHNRLGHVNFRYLKFMTNHGLISGIDNNSKTCEICIQVKMTKKPFPKSGAFWHL